jgi:hypothetical protein
MDFWGMLWPAILIFAVLVLVKQLRGRRVSDEIWPPETADQPARTRRTDFLARAAAEPQESEWLRPESTASTQPQQPRPQPRQPQSQPQTEDVTVFLRKQVPPRDEPPRSWIGGHPMMPEHIEWPRGINPERKDDGPVPLHFVCQIALADCPPELWGGHGPREGWLLLFANSNACGFEGPETFRFLHIRETGQERLPPADIGPVHDGMYTGSTSWISRESAYPRIPVDLVAMPNRLYERDGTAYAVPENLDALLYDGQDIGENRPWSGVSEPFSWGCIALAADRAVKAMDDPRGSANAARYHANMVEKLLAPGGFEGVVAVKQAELAKWADKPDVPELLAADPATLDEAAARRRAHIEKLQQGLGDVEALLKRYPDPQSLLAFLDSQGAANIETAMHAGLVTLRDRAEAAGRDAPLSPPEWQALKGELAASQTIWALGWGHSNERGLPVTVVERELELLVRLSHHLKSACADEAKRCYLDPALRTLVPAEVIPGLEAHLRSFYDNRPHRMGGYSDGVQSDVGPHPTGQLLLLQLACDYALETLWGDCGAIYAFISRSDLDAGAFDKAELHLECH